MDFENQIKKIRKKENLTQEQFAIKLNISRQTVSNWENNKNLPDIGMLILMSNVFNLSLDDLIKGKQEMNNMTEKIIQDGSENKRAKYNMVTAMVGLGLLMIGVSLLLIKGMSVEFIDSNGILHENFFLLPLGWLFIGCGVMSFLTLGIRKMMHQFQEKKN